MKTETNRWRRTIAEEYAKLSAADALSALAESQIEGDQDWDNGSTVFTFVDGSRLRVMGTEVLVLDD